MDFFWLSETHALSQWSARATLMSTHWLQQLGQSLRTSQRVLMTFWLVNKAFELLTHLKTSLEVLFSQMLNLSQAILSVFNRNCVMFWKSNWLSQCVQVNLIIMHFPILIFCMEGWRAWISKVLSYQSLFQGWEPREKPNQTWSTCIEAQQRLNWISSGGCLPITSVFSFSIWTLKLFSRIL